MQWGVGAYKSQASPLTRTLVPPPMQCNERMVCMQLGSIKSNPLMRAQLNHTL